MEQKKEDKFEKAKDRALRRVIAKYPRDELKLKTFYESSPGARKFMPDPTMEQKKDYQNFYEEELKKIESGENIKKLDEKIEENEELKKADMHDAALKAWIKRKDNEIKELKNQSEEKLKNQSEEKTQKIEELTDTLKRLQAEFENYKKWSAKEKTEFAKYANADMIEKMLPVLDGFEIALKNTGDKDKFIEGMKMIYAQFHSMLEAEGLRPIKAAGEKFDPYKHEVLMKEESDKPEETILEEFQKGYMLNDKVLRHSKVKVSGK